MHRKLIVALMATMLAAPTFGASQNPAASGRAHPATRAHANAVAGEADAERIEACGQVANGFLDDLEKGDFKAAAANFNGRMKGALGADKLGETWKSFGALFGKLESRGHAQTVMYQDMPVVSTPLHFANGDFVSQLACDSDGKIAGFYIRPLPTATAASASSAQ